METLHTPAPLRKTGLTSFRHYLKFGLFALLYLVIVSRYIWIKEEYSKWTLDDLLLNNGEMVKFYLLSITLIFFILYLLFGSKYGVYRSVVAKNLYVLTAITSFIYLVVLFVFEFDYHKISAPEQIALATLAGIFTILSVLPSIFEKNKNVYLFVAKILPIFLILSIFIIQYWHRDVHLWKCFWLWICPLLFFFVRPTKQY